MTNINSFSLKPDLIFQERIKVYKERDKKRNSKNTREYLWEITNFKELEKTMKKFKIEVDDIIWSREVNFYFNIYPWCTWWIILRFLLEFWDENYVYYFWLSSFNWLKEELQKLEQESEKKGIAKNKIIMYNNESLVWYLKEIVEKIEDILKIKYKNYFTIRKHRLSFLFQKWESEKQYIFFKWENFPYILWLWAEQYLNSKVLLSEEFINGWKKAMKKS